VRTHRVLDSACWAHLTAPPSVHVLTGTPNARAAAPVPIAPAKLGSRWIDAARHPVTASSQLTIVLDGTPDDGRARICAARWPRLRQCLLVFGIRPSRMFLCRRTGEYGQIAADAAASYTLTTDAVAAASTPLLLSELFTGQSAAPHRRKVRSTFAHGRW